MVLKYTFESNGFRGWSDVDQFFVYTPPVACVAMVGMAVIYFFTAVIIDTMKLNAYKKADSR